jgi:hypothetical protein
MHGVPVRWSIWQLKRCLPTVKVSKLVAFIVCPPWAVALFD